jgi:two-component system NtrC family sensor kinase
VKKTKEEFKAMPKVMVVDDEDSIRALLTISLTQKGYEVVSAENGEKGIEVFKKERPQFVITDIKMPGLDGIEVLKRIRELDSDTRVIVITGHGDMKSAITALQHEASDFINKPITDEALTIALKRGEEILSMKKQLRDYTTDLEVMVKEATDELRVALDFQKNLIQNSIDGIIAEAKDGTIIVFNQEAEHLFGYTADEIVGKMKMDELCPPGVSEIIKEKLNSEAYGGKNRLVNYESTVISKSAEKIPVRLSAIVLFDKDVRTGNVCFLQDLRVIKRLQKELIENERLSATGQAVAGLAHYIKNILNGLLGGVYIVNIGLKKEKPELFPKGWAMVENNIEKISDLVMNMLIFSKEREPDNVLCSPNDIAQQIYDLLEQKAIQSEVKLIKDFDLSIDDCYLDPKGLHRCLLNLVSNAIDACNEGGRKDEARSVVIRSRRENDSIKFDIEDNGVGMTKEVQENLFQRFFSTKGPKGTGLGLVVTRKTIEEQGGGITFESSPGKGTTFTLRLPYRTSLEET